MEGMRETREAQGGEEVHRTDEVAERSVFV